MIPRSMKFNGTTQEEELNKAQQLSSMPIPIQQPMHEIDLITNNNTNNNNDSNNLIALNGIMNNNELHLINTSIPNHHQQQNNNNLYLEKIQDERKDLEDKCHTLRSRIAALRLHRQQIQKSTRHVLHQQNLLSTRYNMTERCRMDAISRLNSAMARRIMNDNLLNIMRRINVTNDCFHIWHMGSYGTINGLRLGSYVPPVPTSSTADVDGSSGSSQTTSSHSLGRMELSTPSSSSSSSSTPPSDNWDDNKFKVPWSEINAALGTIALLLVILSEKPSSRIKYTTHRITPLGSFSKVAILHNAGKSATTYNLHSDDSFQLFGKRNFNTALNGLLRCLADATVAAARWDKTVAPPHSIEEISKGEYAIGGLPIAYSSNGERWTRALKYFLTNLKWLVAYTTKHVDR